MTLGGVGRLSAGLFAAVVACLALHRAYADSAYRDGLGYTDLPAEDTPGRLEAYEEAIRRAPDAFTYRLRAGQIRQARAEGREPGDDADLEAASRHLRRAVERHPLDARARVSLAKLLLLEGDVELALTEARLAFELGPRHPSVQIAALRVAIIAWGTFGRVDGLELALQMDARRAARFGATRTPREAVVALRARADTALGDLLEASGGDVERLETALRWSSSALPDIAAVIESALRRSRRRER